MKKSLAVLLFTLLLHSFSGACTDPDSISQASQHSHATLQLIRPQDAISNRQVYRLTSNQGHDFMLKHNSSQVLELSPGLFSMQLSYGLGITNTFSLQMEAGKTYYVVLKSRPDVLATQPFVGEVNQQSYERLKNQLVRLVP